jgi:isoquinoline 1-oxidoreductase beta subunit
VEVSLLERPGDLPAGAGEPTIAPTPAAVLNAVYAATGTRHRRLPIRTRGGAPV